MIEPALGRGLQLVGATTRKSHFLFVATTSIGVLVDVNQSGSLSGALHLSFALPS